jgi:two-component system, LytTR family, response regulator LytT
MKVILVEDEKSAQDNMRAILKEIDPSIEVLACLDSIHHTVSYFSENPPPDLAFFDIHLADGSAFKIFDQVDVQCPVVFTTAYSEYALKAFKVNSIDYLLKPIKRTELEFAINKFKNVQSKSSAIIGKEILSALKSFYPEEKKQYKKSLLIKKFDGFIPIRTDDIAFFYIDAGIVYCQMQNGQNYAVHEKMDRIQEELNPKDFFRTNRRALVSKERIKEVRNYLGGKLLIKSDVETKEKLLVSKGRVADFRKWLEE